MNKKVVSVLKEVREKLGLSTIQMSKELGYKSEAHVWLVEKGYRNGTLLLCKRLIEVAEKAGIKGITLDKLLSD